MLPIIARADNDDLLSNSLLIAPVWFLSVLACRLLGQHSVLGGDRDGNA
jgi:hypothetical protein